ncbi:ATP-binding cassette domain-containing protein [Paenibacillus sp. T1]|uniref:ATP-binding cassette domain-containing protein n=2 Tax=Paenibacillus glycinis TaxID=2697035 RepID=A0ABW9XMQ7_9BACL|nr:ATP-binding cassette domain-containing protein [Paenibacillus glycinis]
MPSPMRIYAGVEAGADPAAPSPLTVKEGRQWLDRRMNGVAGGANAAIGRKRELIGESAAAQGKKPESMPSEAPPAAAEGSQSVSADGAEILPSEVPPSAAVAESRPASANDLAFADDNRMPAGAMSGNLPGSAPAADVPQSGAYPANPAINEATAREARKSAWRLLLDKPVAAPAAAPAVSFKDVWFKYDKNGPDAIKDLSFEVKKGEFYCLVGGNGTGKSTTLSLMSGLLRPYRGKVRIDGRNPAALGADELFANLLAVLPQNPQTLFVKKTVELDLHEIFDGARLTKEQKREKVEAAIRFAELEPLLGMHPYDLSGGEQQRAALAKVLLLEPSILLLDEPTKGLDGFFKAKLGEFLQKLNAGGVTIVMVSHDIEFCARYGETCAMFFDGGVIASKAAKPFFAGNGFYTTAANRMARHRWPDAVTAEDVIARCDDSR